MKIFDFQLLCVLKYFQSFQTKTNVTDVSKFPADYTLLNFYFQNNETSIIKISFVTFVVQVRIKKCPAFLPDILIYVENS